MNAVIAMLIAFVAIGIASARSERVGYGWMVLVILLYLVHAYVSG